LSRKISFITGGIRSGKSRYALSLAQRYKGKGVFIATAEPFDNEMKERIEKHKEERGDTFQTIEEPRNLKKAILSIPSHTDIAVIDCLTVWLGNLLHYHNNKVEDMYETEEFLNCLDTPPCDLIIVSNEVGMGIISDNPMARNFQNLSGSVNQRIANIAERVIMMVSGLPLNVKGSIT